LLNFLEICWFIVLFSTVVCKNKLLFFLLNQANFLNLMLFYYKFIDMGGARGKGAGVGGTCPPCPCSPFAPPEKY